MGLSLGGPLLGSGQSDPGLARDTVSALQIAVVSIAGTGPAAGVALVLPVMAGFAGEAVVFAFLLVLGVMILLTNTFVEFAKRIPSAGSLLAWNSAGLGPSFGFIFGWFFVGGYLTIAATAFSVLGGFSHNYIEATFSLDIPWWVFTAVCATYIVVLAWRGIAQTVESALILLVIEVGVLLLLAVWLVTTGHVESRATPFNPGASPGGWAGVGLAMTFGVLSMVGYEGAATLAEEAKDGRRAVSRGLWISGIATPVFFFIMSYALISSYGPIEKFAADPLAAETLAKRVWQGFGGVISVVVILSALAFGQTSFNAGVRVIYALGRLKLIPAALGRVHPTYQTPSAAIVLFAILTLGASIIVAAAVGPIGAFAYWGFMTAVAFLAIYALTNIALFLYIRRTEPAAFSAWRHALLPLAAMGGVLYPLYRTVNPLPPSPYPLLVSIVFGWATLGGLLLLFLRSSGKANIEDVTRAFAARNSE